VSSLSIYGASDKIKGASVKIRSRLQKSILLLYNIGKVLYILYGKDDFSLTQALESLKREKADPDTLAANTVTFDAQQLSLARLVEACSAVPFLSPVRIVVVKGLLGVFEPKQTQSRDKKLSLKGTEAGLGEWRELPNYVKQLPATTILILVDSGDIKGNNPLLKLLSPLAKVRVFPLLKKEELSRWINDRVRKSGGTIFPEAVNLLIEVVGPDLWVMSSEVDKLVLFAQGRPITEKDVRCVTTFAREDSIFSLVDAVLEGESRRAQIILWRMMREGVSPSYILAMIARQLRLILLAKGLEKQGAGGKAVGRPEYVSEYSLKKAQEQAKAYSFERVKALFEKLLETDAAIKSGKYDSELALELLLLGH